AASPRVASNLALSMNRSGAAVVAWQLVVNGQSEIQAVVRDGPNDRFGVPEQLTQGNQGGASQVGVDARGEAIAARGILGAAPAATRPRGGPWSDAAMVPGAVAIGPRLAVTPSGTALLASAGGAEMNGYQLSYETKQLPDGGWSQPQPAGTSYYEPFDAAFD